MRVSIWLLSIVSASGVLAQTPQPSSVAAPAFDALLRERPPLRATLLGKHPRLFFDTEGLAALREKAKAHPQAWAAFLSASTALTISPPEPPAQGRGVHYRVGLALPEAALAFAIGRDPAHFARAKAWIDAAVAYEPWGYTYSKPNQDIPAGFLLYGLSFAYDLLAPDLAPPDRARVAAKIGEKASQLYEIYRYKPNKRYSFSQNHTFINAAAIGFAGIVLHGQRRESEEWIAYSRAVFDRVVRTYSPDGYYYEGYHYFEFSVPWIVHYLDAIEFNTGEQWYERLRLDLAKLYVAHSLVPGPAAGPAGPAEAGPYAGPYDGPSAGLHTGAGGQVFDFGDTGRGAAGRAAGEIELLGAHDILHRLAARYRDPQAAVVAEWVTRQMRLPQREPLWTFIWRNPEPLPGRIDEIPRFHHFRNAGVVFYRTTWDPGATAMAFKCGPPEGHHVTALLPQLPEWRLSTGHAHPDAGSFILISAGRYLTGDAGYTGVKLTADHNAVLIDGRGQDNDGRHETFRDVPYERLNGIRIVSAEAGRQGIEIVADGTDAFAPALGVQRWRRTFRFDGRDAFEVEDEVATKEPRRVGVMLQSDGPVEQSGPSGFRIDSGGVGLAIQVEPALAAAPSATGLENSHAAGLKSGPTQRTSAPGPAAADRGIAIEPHVVTTQGRPGSVEQGEREQRGVRLTVTRPPATQTQTKMHLKITPDAGATRPQ